MKKVVIQGAGIAGIAAALDAAEKGREVLLVEKTPWIGGKLSQLDFQFPNDQCGMCQVYSLFGERIPQFCLRRILDHPRIEVLTNSEVVEVRGKKGNLKIKIRKSPRGVRETCYACDRCAEVCPVEIPDPFNYGTTKAIYLKYPNCFPNIYAIDFERCTRCGECVKVCPVDAIDLNEKEEIEEVEADILLVASGIKERDLGYLEEYGYGRIKNAIISTHFERLLSELGPTEGLPRRPSDGKIARKVAFIQCAGSRDRKNPNCSSICCMYALKEARLLRRKIPDAEPVIFYMDMRTYGKGEYRYFLTSGVKTVPSRPAKVDEDDEGNPILYYVDADGNQRKEKFDLIVFSVGTETAEETFKDTDGVVKLYDQPLEISEAISAAYASTLEVEPSGEGDGKIWQPSEDKEEIAYVITSYAEGRVNEADLPGPTFRTNYLRRQEEVKELYDELKKADIERFVVLASEPYYVDYNLRKFFDPLQYQIVDVYQGDPLFAIKSAVRRLKYLNPVPGERKPVKGSVVVIGGGIAGMTAAASLAERGFEVHIIEKNGSFGGNALRIGKTIDGKDVGKTLKELEKRLKKAGVKIHLNSELTGARGFSGSWVLEVKEGEGDIRIEAGAIVVATGARAYEPSEYLYGEDERILTQLELEEKLAAGDFSADTVVMIQCVGSRNEKHPWCSRICCSDAIKNAIEIKEKSPRTEVFILYRDIMTYGALENFYRKARELGVIFLRFKEGEEPEVKKEDNGLSVRIRDIVLNRTVEIEPDLLVLSTGIVPNPDNERIAEILRIPLDEDGFFMPANIKFNPLESPHPGIYFAGLSHSPRNIDESISQAEAAASRAISFLNSKRLPSRNLVSYVHERRCAGCGFCVDLCPFEARYLDEELKVAKVINSICQGCGLCVSGCPSGATELVGTEDRAIITSLGHL